MGQFEAEFLEILEKSFEDLNKSLQERKQNVEPSDQYVVLVAGGFFAVISKRVSCSLRLGMQSQSLWTRYHFEKQQKRHQHLILINIPLHYRNC